jgi:hypothetical protein
LFFGKTLSGTLHGFEGAVKVSPSMRIRKVLVSFVFERINFVVKPAIISWFSELRTMVIWKN